MSASNPESVVKDLLAMAGITVGGNEPWDIHVHDNRLYRAVISRGSLGLGEAYMNGWWDAERVDEFIARVLRANLPQKLRRNFRTLIALLKARLFNMQSPNRIRRDVQHHYDLDTDLHMSFLDPYNQYSCGYFRETTDLDEAQEHKLELICRKLDLKPTDHLLDIGCGWGGLAKFAASNYGCRVTGITLSKKQCAFAREYCKDLPVTIELKDYRQLENQYDKIVSVGMMEHVGPKNYRTMMEVARRCLHPDGLFLLHTIGSKLSYTSNDPWLTKYIFPGSVLPSPQQVTSAISGIFVLEDWHNFGVYYAHTLRAWMENFDRSWDKLKVRYDARFYRMWKYYLLMCAGTFDARYNQLWQIVLSPNGVRCGYDSVR